MVHGEILGVSLLMEDVLQSGQQDISMVPDDSDEEGENPKGTSGQGKSPVRSRPRSAASGKSASRPGSSGRAKESGQDGRATILRIHAFVTTIQLVLLACVFLCTRYSPGGNRARHGL